jgi:hypothetical protein
MIVIGMKTQQHSVSSLPIVLGIILLALAVAGCSDVTHNDPHIRGTAAGHF